MRQLKVRPKKGPAPVLQQTNVFGGRMDGHTTYVFYLNLVAQLPPFGSSKVFVRDKASADKALTRLGQGNILERP